MKRIFKFMFEVFWANYAMKHVIFTGEHPSDEEKSKALKGLHLS